MINIQSLQGLLCDMIPIDGGGHGSTFYSRCGCRQAVEQFPFAV